MGVSYMEMLQTPDSVVGMDLDFMSLEAQFSGELPKNTETT